MGLNRNETGLCVAERGWGVLSPDGDNIQQEYNTLCLTRTSKLLDHPKPRTLGGEGASDR
jgi:hypothetical protein